MYRRTTAMYLTMFLVLFVSGVSFAQPAITNYSFEDGTWNDPDANGYKAAGAINGWSTTGAASWGINQRGGPLAGTVGDTPSGSDFLFIQGSATNTVSQNLSGWQEGYRYDLKFHVNVREGAPGMDLEVRIGTKTIYGPVRHFYRQGWREVVIPFRYQAAVMGGTDLRFVTSFTGADTTILIDRVELSYARQIDFQAIMNGFEAQLDGASSGAWSGSIWPTIVDGAKGYQQDGPGFQIGDHTGNGIMDKTHLGLLGPIVNDDPCARSLLGNTKMDNIQTAFMLNRNFVTTREFSFQAQLTNWSRASAVITDPVNCTLTNRPVWTNLMNLTTNTEAAISVTIDTGVFIVGNTSINEVFDLPSMWGPSSLLNDFSEGFGDDIADLFAAYLTIGDQDKVDYMQHILASVLIDGFRANLDTFILELIEDMLKSDKSVPDVWEPLEEGDEKNYTVVNPPDQTTQVALSPPVAIVIDGLGTVTILQIGLFVPGASFGNGVRNWVNSYSLGTNGLAPQVVGQNLYGYPTLLTAGGDLNGDSTTNLASYTAAGGILSDFQQLEDVAVAQQFLWFQQPTASSPLDYGSPVAFNVFADFDGSGTTYQWYAGTSAGSLNPVGPATANWFFDTDFYSFDGDTRDRFYQVTATTDKCGLPETIYSDVVQIVGGAPPVITVTGATGGGNFVPGAPVTLSVSATCTAGQFFTYQWQKDISGTWTNIAGATAASLDLGGAEAADAGSYRCIVYNRVDSPLESNPTYYAVSGTATVSVAPSIEITEQPQGAILSVGDNYTLSVAATVSSGTLSYKWQINTGAGWTDLNAFGGATTWALTNAQLSDAAAYRVVVRNVHALGTYTLNSAVANITVGTGLVFYVDPTSPSQDGLSWATAYHTLQAGINAAAGAGGGEVWVAAATYGENRTENWGGVLGSLVMKDNVSLYGGFEGYAGGAGMQETLRYQRRVTTNNTIIDGSTARGGAAAYHTVVFGRSTASTVNALLDGFIIQGGNAAGTTGVYHTWRGGGIYVYQSSPTISNCRILDNTAAVSGGGMANEPGTEAGSNPRIVNTLFRTNTANRAEDDYSGPVAPPWSGTGPTPVRGGGALFNNANASFSSNPTLNFVTMHSNTVGNPGYTAQGALSAGMYSFASSPVLSNSIVWNNTAAPSLYGSVVNDRVAGGTTATSVTYSDVQTAGYSTYATFNPADAPNDLGPGTLYGDAYLDTWHLRLTTAVSQQGSWSFLPPVPLDAFTATWNQYIGGGDGADGMSFVYQAGANASFGEAGSGGNGLVVSFRTYDGSVGSPNYDLITLRYNGAEITSAAVDAVTPALGLRTATWVPVNVTVTAAGGVSVSWNGTEYINTTVPGWDADASWYMGLGGRTGGMWDIHGASSFVVTSTMGTLPAGAGNISADPLLAGNIPGVGSPAVDTANPASTITEDLKGAVRPLNGGVALRHDMGAYEINALVVSAACLDTTVDIGLRTTIDDPAEVFDAAGSIIEAGLWYLDLQPYTFGPADVGNVVPLTLTVYDKTGASDTCTTNVTVIGGCDPPTITTCAPNPGPLSLNASCQVALPDLTGAVVYTDPTCLDAVVTQNPVAGTLISADTLVTLTVTNTAGSVNCSVTVTVADTTPPVITRTGPSPVTVECGAGYTDAGATATDNCDGSLTGSIVVVNPVNANAVGSYTVTYNVSDSSSNAAAQVTRTVNVVDTTAPVISLTGANPQTINLNDPYVELGATATDACDGSLTGSIVIDASAVNTNAVGTYFVDYDVSDGASNAATTVQRQVDVVDTSQPFVQNVAVDTGWTVLVTYNKAMGAGVLTAGNYTISGAGRGTLAANPANVALVAGSTYRLTWNCPGIMRNGADVTITVAGTVQDSLGNAMLPAGVSGTDVGGGIAAAPVITRTGTSPVSVQCGATYTDAGATAVDSCGTSLTSSIVTVNPVNTAVKGAYTVTYNVSDAAGNAAAQVTRTVNVIDTTAPVITRTGSATVSVECGTTYTDGGATATDSCDGNLTSSIVVTNPVNTAVVGAYTVRYNVSDSATNAATEVTRTVNVVDTTAPVITRTGSATVSVECGTTYTDAGATATDSCEGSLTGSIVVTNPVNTAVVGAYTVRYNVSDSATNAAAEVTRTVNVVDTTAPVITRNGSATVSVECGTTYTDAGATATDSCEGSLTGSIVVTNPVNTAVVGAYTVRYNVSDSATNAAAEVTRTVNVVDTTDPVITRLGSNPVSVECGSAYSDAGATALDSCEGDLTASIVTVNPVNTNVPGAYTVTYNVVDTALNAAAQRIRTVNVVDSTSPTITITGDNPATVECNTAYTDAGATASDSCEGDLTGAIVVVNNVNTAVTGSYTVTYNVSDSASNAATEAVRTVNVVDTTAPVITLTGTTPVSVECGASYTDAGATASDSCDGNLTGAISVVNNVNTSATGSYTVTYDVSDAASNAATQVVRTVNVVDTAVPVITLNGSSIVNVNLGDSYTDAGATAADTCDGDISGAIVVGGDTVNTGTVGIYVITYNVSDAASNNAVEVTRTVNVIDVTQPSVASVTVLTGTTVEVVFTKDMGAGVLTAGNYTISGTGAGTLSANPNGVSGSGTTYVLTWTGCPQLMRNGGNVVITVAGGVQDDVGNPMTTPFDGVDTGGGIATLPTITVTGDNPATVECAGTYTDAGATAADGCGTDLTGSIVVNTSAVNTALVGSYTVTYNVTDAAGNAAVQATRTVDVVDTTAPVIALNGANPASVECATTYTDAGATATDTCGGNLTASIVADTSAVNTAAVGSYTVTYNVSDASANAAVEVTRTVNVVDTTAPVITRLGNATVVVECGDTYTDAGATAADSCEGDLTGSIVVNNPVNTSVAGNYTVTYNVSDASANAATQRTRTVTVEDTTVPVITLTGTSPVTVECGTTYTDAGATAADTCDGDLTSSIVTVNPVDAGTVGVYTVTYNVSDSSTNSALAVTRTVNVEDTTAPVITLLGSPTVSVNLGDSYTDAGATATDSCVGDLTASIVTVNPVNTSVLGQYFVTYNVSDASSNAAVEVTREVNVIDTSEPSVTSVLVVDGHTVRVTFTKDMGAGALVATNYTASGAGRGTLSANPANVTGSGAVYDLTWNCPQLMVNGGNLTITVSASLTDDIGNPIVAPLAGTGVAIAALPTVVLTPADNPVTIECGVVWTQPTRTWTDSCGTVLTPQAPNFGGLIPNNPTVGSYAVTFSANDAAGNLGTYVLDVDVVDTQAPVISLVGANPQTIQLNDPYVELGATASDVCQGTLTSSIVIDASAVNTSAEGSYTVTYNVSDASSNAATEVTRTVNVIDSVQPFVTSVAVEDGLNVLVTFSRAMGAGVTDASNYTLSGSGAGTLAANPDSVALDSGNTYRLTWSCPSLMTAGGDITVTVADAVEDVAANVMTDPKSGTDAGGAVAALPVITLLGTSPVDVMLNDTYTDAGATAADACATDISASIVVGGDTVDTAVEGAYVVTYNVTDAAGNAAAEVTRTVNVVSSPSLAVAPIADIEIAEAGSGSLTAVATGGSGSYTYQWSIWDSGSSVFVTLTEGGGYAGVDTATLTIDPFDSATMAGLYQVEVNDGVDTVTTTVNVSLEVTGVPAAGGLGLAALALAAALGGVAALRRRK